MKFVKNFVRVEALALQRALELQKETGHGHLYLANSRLQDEFGWAADMAKIEMRDHGVFCGYGRLSPEKFGLAGEIEEFADIKGSDEIYGVEPYLGRLYLFTFNDPKTNNGALYVFVKIVKRIKDSDWEIVLESAWRVKSKCGFHENLFYRDNQNPELVH